MGKTSRRQLATYIVLEHGVLMRGALPYPVPARGGSRLRTPFPRGHDTRAAIAKLGASIDRHGYVNKVPWLGSTTRLQVPLSMRLMGWSCSLVDAAAGSRSIAACNRVVQVAAPGMWASPMGQHQWFVVLGIRKGSNGWNPVRARDGARCPAASRRVSRKIESSKKGAERG